MYVKPLIILLALAHYSTQPSLALESDAKQPIEIQANLMTLDEATGVTRYRGNVRLRQGSILVTADKLLLQSADGKLQRMHISGTQTKPASFQQTVEAGQIARAKAQTIEYDAEKSHLMLSGQAELTQANNFIRSERIDYNTLSNSLIAGKQVLSEQPTDKEDRVHIVITPEADK